MKYIEYMYFIDILVTVIHSVIRLEQHVYHSIYNTTIR